MARYLITHSLLSSWLYLMKENPYEDATSERDQMAEFMQVLRREPTPTTEAMQNGIVFENLVTAILDNEPEFGFFQAYDDNESYIIPAETKEHKWYEAALKVAKRCSGGALQYKAKKEIEVSGMKFLLYGRLDCLRAGEVIDIKFTKSYDVGKYFDSTQHPTYLELIPEAEKFTYIISNGTSVWSETYRRDETPSIYPYIQDFIDWLNSVGLMSVYKEHWISV